MFCLGEKVCVDAPPCHTDVEPEPALEYSKVGCVCKMRQTTHIILIDSQQPQIKTHQ